ncbi:nuclear transport factor 2B [Dendrobium catenatum]|nr:nuclear transport factor 2B [Dendrobium catenatum]
MQKEEGEMGGGAEAQMEMVGKAFVKHYYGLFDAGSRPALAGLYHPSTSILSFEGRRFDGADSIGRHLSQLPFDLCRHMVATVDCQGSPFAAGGILVFVTGSLQLSGEEHSLSFSQMFQLVQSTEGRFYVQNDIFRLNYG